MTVKLDDGGARRHGVADGDGPANPDGGPVTYLREAPSESFDAKDRASVTWTARFRRRPGADPPDGDRRRGRDDERHGDDHRRVSAASTPTASTQPPTVSVTADALTVAPGGAVLLTAPASDPDGGVLTYAWSAPSGTFDATDRAAASWTAPPEPAPVEIPVSVTDDESDTASAGGDGDGSQARPPPYRASSCSCSARSWHAVRGLLARKHDPSPAFARTAGARCPSPARSLIAVARECRSVFIERDALAITLSLGEADRHRRQRGRRGIRREALDLVDARGDRRCSGLRPVDASGRHRRRRQRATVDLTVRENEEVNPETLVLDVEPDADAVETLPTPTACRR